MNEPPPVNGKTGARTPSKRWLLLPVLLLGLGVAYTETRHPLKAPPIFRAEAQMEILHSAPDASSDPLGNTPPQADESLATQMALIQGGEMARRTLNQMKNEALIRGLPADAVPFTPAQIQKAVRVTNPPGTSLLTVTADADDPEQAGKLAEAVVRAYVLWKQEDAQKDFKGSLRNLRDEFDKAQRAAQTAQRQEIEFRLAYLHSRGSADPEAARLQQEFNGRQLGQNAEIATEIDRKLQTALMTARLQGDLVPARVRIIEHGTVSNTPVSQ